MTSVTYDVFFNVDAAESFTGTNAIAGIDLTFVYDNTELGNFDPVADTANLPVGAGITVGTPFNKLNYVFFSIPEIFLFPLQFNAGTQNLLGSLTFDIFDPAQAYDGSADFMVLSQIGDPFNGFLLDDATTPDTSGTVLQFGGADGADVGVNAVPVPGAVWLLGSGLLGLVGIRRRRGI